MSNVEKKIPLISMMLPFNFRTDHQNVERTEQKDGQRCFRFRYCFG